MVGREAELAKLVSLFDVVRAGRGRLAMIIGEPGLGKSRLLSEFRSAVGATEPGSSGSAVWIEGRCATYGRTVPYHLVLDLVRSMLDIPFAASEEETRVLLDSGLAKLLGNEAGDIEPYLAHLLSLPLRGEAADRVQLDPDFLQGRYGASMVRVIRALSGADEGRVVPVIVVAEDIHWSDPASADLLIKLMPLLTRLPVLQLFVGRNETDAPGWKIVAQAQAVYADALTDIRLNPLSDEDSRGLVANLLEIESLPESVRDAILARAEGNPFFVEEVIRMLIERGAIVRQGDRWLANDTIVNVEIPETLHGLLLARIDQLPEQAKRSLRVASVIGRQFPVRVLERVLEVPEN
jgi:predicted ATPase